MMAYAKREGEREREEEEERKRQRERDRKTLRKIIIWIMIENKKRNKLSEGGRQQERGGRMERRKKEWTQGGE